MNDMNDTIFCTADRHSLDVIIAGLIDGGHPFSYLANQAIGGPEGTGCSHHLVVTDAAAVQAIWNIANRQMMAVTTLPRRAAEIKTNT